MLKELKSVKNEKQKLEVMLMKSEENSHVLIVADLKIKIKKLE